MPHSVTAFCLDLSGTCLIFLISHHCMRSGVLRGKMIPIGIEATFAIRPSCYSISLFVIT